MRKVYSGLDVLKFICALFILFYHYFSEHGPLPGIIDETLSLYAVAVATFMTISGFLVFDKIRDIKERNERWQVVKKQVGRILTIYLVWSIPYLIFTVSQWNLKDITFKFLFWQIQRWIFQSTFYTIWFMPALAIGLVVAFLVAEYLPSKIVIVMAFVMYIVGALFLTYSFVVREIPGYDVVLNFVNTWLGGARGGLFFAFPLIILGKVITNIKIHIKQKSVIFFVGLSLLLLVAEALVTRSIAGHTGIDLAMMMIPTVFFIVLLGIQTNVQMGQWNVWMRKMSTLIFMSQRLFLTVIPALLTEKAYVCIFENNYRGAVFVFSSTIVFSMSIVLLSKKFTILKKIY